MQCIEQKSKKYKRKIRLAKKQPKKKKCPNIFLFSKINNVKKNKKKKDSVK